MNLIETKVSDVDRILITIGMEDMSATQLKSYKASISRTYRKAYQRPVTIATVRSEGPLFTVTVIKV